MANSVELLGSGERDSVRGLHIYYCHNFSAYEIGWEAVMERIE